MTDPLSEKPTSPETGATPDADVKIEQLLLAGLDHYFQGEYDRAIDLWGRVLFLDRQHARARAYIERARAAAAERIRESEELLHTGAEAFKRGDAIEARELLNSAAERGRDEALPLLDRLTRLEMAAGPVGETRSPIRAGRVIARSSASDEYGRGARSGAGRPRVRVVPLIVLFVVLAIGGYVALSWDRVEALWSATPVPLVAGPTPDDQRGVPVPSPAEMRYERAQRLADGGDVRAALDELSRIEPGDPRRTEADDLRATLQARLLAGGDTGDTTISSPAAR